MSLCQTAAGWLAANSDSRVRPARVSNSPLDDRRDLYALAEVCSFRGCRCSTYPLRPLLYVRIRSRQLFIKTLLPCHREEKKNSFSTGIYTIYVILNNTTCLCIAGNMYHHDV